MPPKCISIIVWSIAVIFEWWCIFADAIRTSAAQLSSQLTASSGQTPSEVSAASAVAASCATLLAKQNLQWEHTMEALALAQREAAAAQQDAAAARAARPALPGLRSRTLSNAGSVVASSANKPPSGGQTPATDQQLQAAAAALLNGAATAPGLQRAGSTESEDEEKNVVPLSRVRLPTDRDDVESDAASVRSASTLELASGAKLPAMRRSSPRPS